MPIIINRMLFVIALLFPALSIAQNVITYPADPASKENKDVPKGEMISFTFADSKIFPGTTRECYIYVPAQYTGDTPACVYVNQDGIQWNAPVVFDNLIQSKEMPVTIGVFVTPGNVLTDSNNNAFPRFNRSFEYDGLGDAYARFILNEIFPEVEKKITKDGRRIKLSKNGNDRAIGGSSSGAICAFTAAWEKPEEFSRVFSAIGTYTGLRGGDRYPTLIRKYEPKPIRVFLQGGRNDLNIYGGDWFKANEQMESALTFAGYEVDHEWGDDGHNVDHGTAIFPKAMRWLWKDWPAPVKKGSSKNQFLSDLLVAGHDWELVGEGYTFTEGTGGNEKGEVYFQDVPRSKTYKVDVNGKVMQLGYDSKNASGTSFGADGKYYVAAGGSKQILSYDKNQKVTVVADSVSGNDLIVANNGNIYVTSPDGSKPGKLILVRPDGKKTVVDDGLKFPNGVTLSPDQKQLYATESATHWVWAYTVMDDGTLSNKQRFGWLHVPDTEENAWPDGLKCDTLGRIFVATRIGIQVLDRQGRVNAIIPAPRSNSQTSNVYFGGPALDILYVTAGDKVFRRKLKTKGVHSFKKPLTPGNARL